MAITRLVREILKYATGSSTGGHTSRRGIRRSPVTAEFLELRSLLTVISVTNLNDSGAGSLRDAVTQANARAGLDEIQFSVSGTITLSTGNLQITDSVALIGNGQSSTIISGNDQSRIFDITNMAKDVTLKDMTLTRGRTFLGGRHGFGGAIRSECYGSLTIDQCTISDCSTTGGSAYGGAITSENSSLTINRSTISNNATTFPDETGLANGGAIFTSHGSLTISNTSISNNSTLGRSARGGAVHSLFTTISITDSSLTNNFTTGSSSHGGALYFELSTATIRRSTFSGNYTLGDESRGGAIFAGGGLLLSEVTVNNNSTSGSNSGGSAIFASSLRMSQSTISGNSDSGLQPLGGAVHISGFSDVVGRISQSTITGNHNVNGGGAGVTADTFDFVIRNSIIAGNTGTTAAPEIKVPSNALASGKFIVTNSLIGNVSGTGLTATGTSAPDANGNFLGGSSQPVIDPHLTPLQAYGGSTRTHNLLASSIAIDRGSNADAVDITNSDAPLTSDQRGIPYQRVDGASVDMGATERQLVVPETLVVDQLTDGDDGEYSPGYLSLREAIKLADMASSSNTITFAPATNGTEFDLNLGSMTISNPLTITGNGVSRTVVDAQQLSRIFDIISTAGNVTFNDMTLKNGRTTGNGTDFWDTTFAGGAIRWNSPGILTLNRTHFTGNATLGERAAGGAILASQGTLVVSESWFSGNSTAGVNSEGGAIAAHLGGLKVRNSTFSGNSTTGDFSEGGAVFSLAGEVTISQSTISSNTASGIDSAAGGLFTQEGNILIAQSTITGNSAPISAGGGIFTLSSPIRILNSIVASNADAGAGPDIWKSQNADDAFLITNSLIGRSNGTGLSETSGSPDASGNLIGGATPQAALNPQLGPLQNNGGRTLTHAILPGSPAIDRGSNAAAIDVTNNNAALTTDQRGVGFARMLDGDQLGTAIVDMGAVEFPGLRVSSPSPNAFSLRPTFQWTPIAGATSYTVQINNESTGVAQFHMGTSTTATYTPPANLAIGRFRMWVRPNFASGVGNWSVPQAFNNLTPPTWTTMARTQLNARPTLTWNALPGAVKYDLWGDNFSTGQKQLIRREVTGTTFTPATDLPMGIHRFWIRGVDARGNFAGWSVLQEFLVVPGPTSVGPLNATFDRTPTFSWNAVAGAASYELYVRNTNTGAMVINGTSVTGTSFTPTTNLTDGPYRWWTFAVSQAFSTGAIKSGGSNSVDVFVGGRTTITSPANSSSTADRTPTFTWRAVDGAVRYELLVNRINPNQRGIIDQKSLTTTSFTPAADLPVGTYRAWVLAVSSTNESIWSAQVEFTVTENEPADDVPEFDDQLAVMLVSLLDEDPVERDGNAEVNSQEANCDRRGFRDGDQESANLLIAHQSIESGEVDRLMMTLDIFDFDLEEHHGIVDRGSESLGLRQ